MPMRVAASLSWKFYLLSSLCLFGAGDIAPLDISGYIQFGALGLLGVCTIKLFGVIKDQQKINDRLADRQDVWEASRHTDHEELNKTLLSMTANCAAVQTRREGHP